MSASTHTIRCVNASDLNELVGLMRAYCDFYQASPADEDLLALVRALLDEPDREGIQLLACDADGRAASVPGQRAPKSSSTPSLSSNRVLRRA